MRPKGRPKERRSEKAKEKTKEGERTKDKGQPTTAERSDKKDEIPYCSSLTPYYLLLTPYSLNKVAGMKQDASA